jgi:hypothetical protein
MTKKEAEIAVRRELARRKLTKPITPAEMLTFTDEMSGELDFVSKSLRPKDIRGWAEKWEAERFRNSN